MFIVFGAFILLLFLGVPIGFSLMLSSFVYLLFHGDISFAVMTQKFVAGANSFTLLAIPFFIATGKFMNSAGITDRLFIFAKVIVGHVPGGLAHANVIASIFFSGMSGSAVADAGGLGTIEINAMQDDGYETEFAGAVTAASAVIGPIVPPSIPMIIYAVLSNTSIAALFAAGYIPGILMGVALMILIYIYSIKYKYPRHPKANLKQVGKAFIQVIPPIITPLIIIGGILSGIFTPTEAGAVALVYSLFLGLFVYKNLNYKKIKEVLIDSAYTTAAVMVIIMASALFAWVMAIERIPFMIGSYLIVLVHNNHLLFLLVTNIFLLLIGCFMEPVAAMTILLPIFLPICNKMGINSVHFGIIVVLNLMIGLLTPPVGVVLNVIADLTNRPFERIFAATCPFLIPLIIVLFLITYFPDIVLVIPKILNLIP
jgi:tripartite ATP-independent transporter DctM subunit